MEQADRNAIQRNIKQLSSLVNMEDLYRELIQCGVIDQNFIERIKVKYKVPQEQAQEFFLCYTKRGPTAFQILVESLEKIGCISEANILRSRQVHRSVVSSSAGELNGSPNHGENGNGHFPQLSPASSNSPTSSASVPSSPLMRNHMSRSVEPLSGTNSPTSSSSSISAADQQLRRLSLSSCSMEDMPPLVVRVRPALQYNMGKTSRDDAYQMLSKPRGYALIINNIDFVGDPEARRDGAEKDTSHLSELLEQFGFEVMIRHNVRKWELIDPETGILKKFADQFEKKNVDACIVAIMSHGKEGNIIRAHDPEDPRTTSRSYWHFYDEILKRFNNRFCPALKGKPKIFILQACQGERKDRGVRRTFVDGKDLTETVKASPNDWAPPEPDNLPEIEDMIVCYSTTPGYVSNRDTVNGTWYIYTLCKVFMEHAWNTELIQLLKKVGKDMRNLYSEHGSKQMSSFHDLGLHNDLYFNPGLYENSGVATESNGHVAEDSPSAITP